MGFSREKGAAGADRRPPALASQFLISVENDLAHFDVLDEFVYPPRMGFQMKDVTMQGHGFFLLGNWKLGVGSWELGVGRATFFL